MKRAFNSDTLAGKYIELLERDLKLERARLELLRRDVDFYRGKCERLELSIMNAQPVAGREYVERTDPKRPGVGETRLRSQMRPIFRDLKQKWDALSAEDQEKAMKDGWNVEDEGKKAQGG